MSVESLEKMTSNWLGLAKKHIKLLILEAKLAKANLPAVALFFGLLVILLLNTWIFILAASCIGFYALTGSLIWSLGLTFLANLVVIIVTLLLLIKYINKVSFTKTRAHLKNYQANKGQTKHDQSAN